MNTENEIVLSCEHISKSFFGNVVLSDVSIECRKGKMLALVGENGAGKSTLINIISGNLQADSGEINYFGTVKKLKNPHQAQEEGVAVVHQQLSLIPRLSVAENLYLGKEKQFGSVVLNNAKIHELAQEEFDRITGFNINVSDTVEMLTPAERQMVEIIKAWVSRPKLLILDEPTSSLSSHEVQHLFNLIRNLKELGTSFIFITHRMDEIFEISDDVVVLKDGVITMKSPTAETNKNQLIGAMVGRERTGDFYPEKSEYAGKEILYSLHGVNMEGGKLRDIDFDLHAGEIVGIAGLEGQGQRDLIRSMFGIEHYSSGEVKLYGKAFVPQNPAKCMKNDIAFIPDDRDLEGMVRCLSVADNINMAILNDISNKIGIINRKAENESVESGTKGLAIKAASPRITMASLSGGNQQKVIFTKWLKRKPRILLLHEPTRGIDVQTKEDIYKVLRDLSNEGMGVIFVSSDMLELIGATDRIVVMYEGRIMGEMKSTDATEEKIMTLSSGEKIEEGGAA